MGGVITVKSCNKIHYQLINSSQQHANSASNCTQAWRHLAESIEIHRIHSAAFESLNWYLGALYISYWEEGSVLPSHSCVLCGLSLTIPLIYREIFTSCLVLTCQVIIARARQKHTQNICLIFITETIAVVLGIRQKRYTHRGIR